MQAITIYCRLFCLLLLTESTNLLYVFLICYEVLLVMIFVYKSVIYVTILAKLFVVSKKFKEIHVTYVVLGLRIGLGRHKITSALVTQLKACLPSCKEARYHRRNIFIIVSSEI